MRTNVRLNFFIATMVSVMLVAASGAQEDLPERVNVDTNVPLPRDL